MSDGMSQDQWEDVLKASTRLKSAGVELFGVALGDGIDLHELESYIGNSGRVYRDNNTDQFLEDVHILLPNSTSRCSNYSPSVSPPRSISIDFQVDSECITNLDMVVLFDASDDTPNLTNPRINLNRYLLLDVLGSLLSSINEEKLRVAVFSFFSTHKLELKLTEPQTRESIFEKVEAIQPQHGSYASYAKAVRKVSLICHWIYRM